MKFETAQHTRQSHMKKLLNNNRGLTLFVVLAMLVILMSIAGASSMFTSISARATANTRNGTIALHIADAGINHAVRELSNNDGTNDMSTMYAASSGTQVVSNNSFGGGTYVVTQQGNASNPPRVKIRSVSTGPNGSTAQIEAWVQSDLSTFGCGGVCTGGAMTISSSYVDSYNSSVGAYGGGNVGTSGNIKSNGDITLQGGSNSIGGSVTAAGTVTSAGTVTGTTTSGASSPVTMPTVAACGPPYSSGTGITGGTYNSSTGAWTVSGGGAGTLAAGTYCFSSITISGGSTMSVSGTTTVSLTGQGDFSGGSVANSTGDPSKLTIQSSYSSASNGIKLSSSGTQAVMTVSCPSCNVVLSGGGNFYGAIIAGSYTQSGGTHLHYDTHLGGASNTNVKMYSWVQTF